MPASVHLQVHSADGTSKSFSLTEHDTFLLGRMDDCHLCVLGDSQVSRHHFLLEACPPIASLRDLGSLNGTHVNGRKCGGREKGETPEQGALRQYPTVTLKNGDRITVGKSTIEVCLEAAPNAAAVPAALPEGDLSRLSPEAMHRLMVAVASRHSPSQGHLAPSLLDDYTITRELGRGGCGAVYLATPNAGGDPVAVKLMLSRAQAEPRAIEQFKREMQVIAGLQHPNIVRFLDSGSDQGTFFFVMEYCDGGSLADVAMARGGTLPPDVLMPWALQALAGLAAAHQEGFVHRDIKPQNILLHRNRTKIGDFGLAKNFQKAGLSGMSITGRYAGTPYFMPPEQIVNFKYVKPVSDVWSFAATLYHLLTGKFPYRFDPKRDPIDIILNENPVPIRDRTPGLGKELATVIDKSLVRNPKDRFPDAGKLLAAIR
ncbi:MAG: protein kinase [Akkermansiaceae bacterium]|nr:protein kinase [Akkermansiaceae bacterium]